MSPRMLLLDRLHCRIPTDHNTFNSVDEVYFLVGGAASGARKIRVAPSAGHDQDDYYPLGTDQNLDNILLAQVDLDEGQEAAFIVAICDQDNAQLAAVSDFLEGVMYAALAYLTDGATAPLATEKFLQAGVDLVTFVTSSHDQVIGAFAVHMRVEHGNVQAKWNPVQGVQFNSTGEVRAAMLANGSESNYVVTVSVADASRFTISGGLLHHGTDRIETARIASVSNGTDLFAATLTQMQDDTIVAQLWAKDSQGALQQKHRATGFPATAISCVGAGLNLAAAVKNKADNTLKSILWQCSGQQLVWQDETETLAAPAHFAAGRYGREFLSKPVTISSTAGNQVVVDIWDTVLSQADGKYKLKRVGGLDAGAGLNGIEVAIAPWSGGVVTAARVPDTSGLHLTVWMLAPDGTMQRAGPTKETGIVIDKVHIINLRPFNEDPGNHVVTATRLQDQTLQLQVWRISDDGAQITLRDTDAPPAPAHVTSLSLAAMGPLQIGDTTLSAGQVATLSVRLEGGALRLTTWMVSANGRLTRSHDQSFEQAKSASIDFQGITPPVPDVGDKMYNLAAAATLADNTLGLFWFSAYIVTVSS
jgi:hypothetical protein